MRRLTWGNPVLAVAMPAEFFPVDVGEDWILGVETGALGVERVVLCPVVQGG